MYAHTSRASQKERLCNHCKHVKPTDVPSPAASAVKHKPLFCNRVKVIVYFLRYKIKAYYDDVKSSVPFSCTAPIRFMDLWIDV